MQKIELLVFGWAVVSAFKACLQGGEDLYWFARSLLYILASFALIISAGCNLEVKNDIVINKVLQS